MSAIARLVLGRDRTDGHILGSSRNVVAVELITRRVSHANAVDAHKTFRFGIRSRIAHLEDVGLAPRTESLGIEVELEVVLDAPATFPAQEHEVDSRFQIELPLFLFTEV